MELRMLTLSLLLLPTPSAKAAPASQGIAGSWKEPGGAVIVIAPCGADLCSRLVKLPSGAPERDINNPDPALRTRALCGLVIGTAFRPSDPEHASGGKLYDPKSGRTYSGAMALHGEELQLRGYLGFKVFGRTETWQRTAAVAVCAR